MALIIFTAILAMVSAEMTVDKWNIMEKGTRVKEQIMTNMEDGLQKIVVPKHNDLSKMTIYNDFNNDVSVYKIHSEKRCYVMKMTKGQKKSFKELHEAIQNHTKEVANPNTPFTGLKPSDYALRPVTLLANDNVDFTSPGAKLAVKKCSGYSIVSGVAIPADTDVNTFAMEQLKASVAKSQNQYDLPIRDLFTCSDALKSYALEEMKRCGGSLKDFKAVCKFRKSSCVYIVSCPYDMRYHYWLCKGKHNFSNIFCCEYECDQPRPTLG